MPRGKPKEPGLKALPNVPYSCGEMAPMMRDTQFSRGALQDVGRDSRYSVMDFGGLPSRGGGSKSPASARFTAGKPNLTRTQIELRAMPETQLTGSYNVQGGQGAPITSSMLRDEGKPILRDGDTG